MTMMITFAMASAAVVGMSRLWAPHRSWWFHIAMGIVLFPTCVLGVVLGMMISGTVYVAYALLALVMIVTLIAVRKRRAIKGAWDDLVR